MFYFIKLAIKNIFSRNSSIVIICFITIALSFFIIINSIFDGTDNGIKVVFKESFTGDIVIKNSDQRRNTLFGEINQFTTESKSIVEIFNYEEITDYLKNNTNIQSFTPQITTFALAEVDNFKQRSAIFAVTGDEYVSMMPGIKILSGVPFKDNEKGAMISNVYAEAYYKQTGKELSIGDTLQLDYVSGTTFRIRAVPITAIFSYPMENSILDRILLVDADTVRSLVGMNISFVETTSIDKDDINLINELDEDFDNMDSLFSEVNDTIIENEIVNLEKSFLSSDSKVTTIDANNWNFIIIKLKDNVSDTKVIKQINKFAKKNSFPIIAINWRNAAGSFAQYIYWLRTICIIGITIVLLAGLIVITNTLVISILDRTREIGTMRAIGADKKNISFICMIETLILTTVSLIISFLLSTIIIIYFRLNPIILTNPLFVQLFGSEKLLPVFSIKLFCNTLYLSMTIALFSWIYPVKEALKISPLKAMKGGN